MYHAEQEEDQFNEKTVVPFSKSAGSLFVKKRKNKFLDDPSACADVSSKVLTKFHGVNDEIWMMPQMFSTEYERIRNSFQYMLIRSKLFLMFENNEDALGLTFKELISFPQSTQQYFPYLRFNQLLSRLTLEQKKNEINHLIRKGLFTQSFQLDFLQQNIKLGVTNRASLDDSGFKLLDCEDAYLNLTQNLNPKIHKAISAPTGGLTKRKSSIIHENVIKKKLSGQLQSPSSSKKGFELGNSSAKKDGGFFGMFKVKSRDSMVAGSSFTEAPHCIAGQNSESNSNLLNES